MSLGERMRRLFMRHLLVARPLFPSVPPSLRPSVSPSLRLSVPLALLLAAAACAPPPPPGALPPPGPTALPPRVAGTPTPGRVYAIGLAVPDGRREPWR